MICEARLIDGVSDPEVRSLFTAARDEDYDAIAKEVGALAEALRQNLNATTQVERRAQLARLKAKLAQVVAIDFFGANGRETVDGLLTGWRPSSRRVPRWRHLKMARRIRPLPWLN